MLGMTQSFGDRLKKYRQDRRLTQQELADKVGVSNKTVSRWESEGGYPDVPVLVPLARALGVTVDDLLDGEKPVRTLGKADWQSLLSFAFALGGGVLFFLFDLFMPGILCYLGYLGCMAYGVYLQKYYTFHSKWFFVGNCVMNFSVNILLAGQLCAFLASGSIMLLVDMVDRFGLSRDITVAALIGTLVLGAAATALTQHLIWKWYGGENLPRLTLTCVPWEWRNLFLFAIPVLSTLFWVAYGGEEPFPAWAYVHQKTLFFGLLAILALTGVLLYCKKGRRGRLALSLFLCTLCAVQGGWGELRRALSLKRGGLWPWDSQMNETLYAAFRELTAPQVALGAVVLVIALLGGLFRFAVREKKEEEREA